MMTNRKSETLWEAQNRLYRNPSQVVYDTTTWTEVERESLRFRLTGSFADILLKAKITLFVTREYEHLVLALRATAKTVHQSFISIPHPSGLTVNRKSKTVYIVSTRNPNQVWEWKPATALLERNDISKSPFGKYLVPTRTKFFSGAHYFHDLAIIQSKLFAVSVGQNGIVHVQLDSPLTESLVWWPRCVEEKNGAPNTKANYIQLNSIAAGKSLIDSYFTASGEVISKRRPGHLNYPVDKKGVVFSGKTREVIARGLTRPHSARLIKNTLWVDNSGYGEIGVIAGSRFQSVTKLPGWTRGLCAVDTILFVGTSRVLRKYKRYAPGIRSENQECGIHAVDIKSGKVLGSLIWPNGNQIFAIDFMSSSETDGFIYKTGVRNTEKTRNFFYRFKV